MIFEFILSVLVILIVLSIIGINRKSNAPPGPLTLPVLGNLLQIALASPTPYLAFHKLSRKYGPVMSLKFGTSNAVIISSYDVMKEMLAKEEATGRELLEMLKVRADYKNLGIVFSVGETWRTMRSYTTSTLRDYGFGNRNSMEDMISEEVHDFAQDLKYKITRNNGVVNCQFLFSVPLVNVLWRMIAGKKLKYSDKKIKYLVESLEEFKSLSVFGAGLLAAFPSLKYIAPGPTGFTAVKNITSNWRVFFKELVDEYRKEYNKTKEVNCYIDDFIQKIEETSSDPNTLFTDEQLVMCIMDLFQAGSDTTEGNFTWAILFMVLRPDIQEKIQNEIENVVGHSRQPQLADRIKMQYTQATILEVFRWGRVTITLLPRQATRDFGYKKWTIKEGTAIYTNTHSIFFDEEFWGDPHVFRPERFLDDNGKIISAKSERIVSFGSGKRICPGETFARDTFFLYLTTLLQMFSFEMVPGDEKPSTEPVIGITLSTVPFRALLKERFPQ